MKVLLLTVLGGVYDFLPPSMCVFVALSPILFTTFSCSELPSRHTCRCHYNISSRLNLRSRILLCHALYRWHRWKENDYSQNRCNPSAGHWLVVTMAGFKFRCLQNFLILTSASTLKSGTYWWTPVMGCYKISTFPHSRALYMETGLVKRGLRHNPKENLNF